MSNERYEPLNQRAPDRVEPKQRYEPLNKRIRSGDQWSTYDDNPPGPTPEIWDYIKRS